MLILVVDRQEFLATRTAPPWARLLTRVLSIRLDEEIAAGASPDAKVTLALRAQALVRPCMRQMLARRLEQVLEEAEHGPTPRLPDPRVPIRRTSVLEAADAIRAVHDLLVAPGPVPARGVAMVHLLVTDGAGPLYHPCSCSDLRAELMAAAANLDPLSNW